MPTIVEIPLLPAQAQIFTVVLNNVTYNMRVMYNTAGDGYWSLDIGDADQNLLIAGIPLVSGTDLLAQYADLNFGGSFVLLTDRSIGEVPRYADLGVTSHLFFLSSS